MKLVRYGAMQDHWNGDGWFIAWASSSMHFTFGIRVRWHFRFTKPPGKPNYTRLYLGPLEFEWSRTNDDL